MSSNSDSSRVEHTRGRPPSVEVERAVFDTVLALVRNHPPSAITRRAVADGAGVSRQTLYNRWATVADIVLDALLERAERTIGSTDATLGEYLSDLASAVDGWARPGLRTIATLAQSDPTVAARFRTDFLAIRHGALRRAVADELDGDPARVELVAELIAGSMWYRILVVDAALDGDWVRAMTTLTSVTP